MSDDPYRTMPPIDIERLKERERWPGQDNISIGTAALRMVPNPNVTTYGKLARDMGHAFTEGSDACTVCGVTCSDSIETLRARRH